MLGDYPACYKINVSGPNGVNPCKGNWNSYHPGGFNTVFCDGSVDFLSSTIDVVDLLPALVTIAGGQGGSGLNEMVPPPD